MGISTPVAFLALAAALTVSAAAKADDSPESTLVPVVTVPAGCTYRDDSPAPIIDCPTAPPPAPQSQPVATTATTDPRRITLDTPHSASGGHPAYASELLAFDSAIALASAVAIGTTGRSEWAVSLLASGPVVHLAHGNGLAAAGSLGLRAAAGLGSYAIVHALCKHDQSEAGLCEVGYGMLVGVPLVTTALALDYLLLAGGSTSGSALGLAATTHRSPWKTASQTLRPTLSIGTTSTVGAAGSF